MSDPSRGASWIEDEWLTLQEASQTNPVSRIAVVSGTIVPGACLLHRDPRQGNTLYVCSQAAALEALKFWPSAEFWGDFSDGQGIPHPLKGRSDG